LDSPQAVPGEFPESVQVGVGWVIAAVQGFSVMWKICAGRVLAMASVIGSVAGPASHGGLASSQGRL
jgi:hypothetical protein